MIKKRLLIFTLFSIMILLLNSSLILSEKNLNHSDETRLNNIIYVNDDNIEGPWQGTLKFPYLKIQDAVNNASDNTIINVFDGIYYENLIINKKLILSGFNFNNTIIDGQFKNNSIRVNSNNVTIKNFTIRNSGGIKEDAGVLLNSNFNLITNCVIYNTKNGVINNETNYNIINNCSFRKNGIAISSIKSFNNLIENCSFDHNSIGINIDNSFEDSISFCYLYSNGISCFINDSKKIELLHCNISDNSVNIGGIFIISSKDIIVKDSNINHNGVGVSISSSNSVNISNCDINLNTHFAISMRASSKNILISKCEIKNNIRFGIYIEENNRCTLFQNNIYDNLLYDLNSKLSYCDAKNNWWGSKLGPLDFEFDFKRIIKWRGGWIKLIPWEIRQFDSIGALWKVNDNNMHSKYFEIKNNVIEFLENDTDLDGIPDWWEEKWGYNSLIWDDHLILDPDGDALNNIQECFTDKWGSNPFYKDIFLEIDWMESMDPEISNKPSIDLINTIINSFENHNIKLHIDLGELEGGEELNNICTPFLSFPKLTDIYFNYFLENDLQNPRKGIFHYGVICNQCPDLNFPFYGWDNFDSFAISGQWLKNENPLINRSELIIGAIIHHLGHTLKLHADIFNGIDNIGTINPFSSQWWIYKNYMSCMNYRYKYKFFTFSDGNNGEGDFNDWENIDFDFFKNSSFPPSY
jgi:parallel beta-helix repeat protein